MCSISVQRKELCNLISFQQQYQNEFIAEWIHAYINYESIYPYLLYLQTIYDDYHQKIRQKLQIEVQVLLVEAEVKQQLDLTINAVDTQVEEGWVRFSKFVNWKFTEILYYWGQLIDITIEQHLQEEQSHQIYDSKASLKKLIKIMYAQTLCLMSFMTLNFQIKHHCKQVLKDYAYPLLQKYNQTHKIQEEHQSEGLSLIDSQQIQMQTILSDLEAIKQGLICLFNSPIYSSQYSNSDINKYNILTNESQSPKSSYFLLGLYMGLGIFILIALFLVLVLDILEFDQDDNHIASMTYIFPMFRGIGLLILYIWGTAWNVYGFLKFKVNFRAILKYGSHYSTPFEIMKKAGFFTLFFCLLLFGYLMGLQYNKDKEQKNQIGIEYAPLFVWLFYFGYIFFPSKQLLNPKGRTYFYSLLKEMILSPFVQMGFVLSFATDQAVSFVTSIKDFAYTICFYGSDFTVTEAQNCLRTNSINGFIVAYVAALVPLLLRMIQCFKQARQSSGSFFGHIQMWNFLKYLASINTSTMSFLSSYYPQLFIPFIVSSIFSTLYSYYWDLKYDWGLLEKRTKIFLLRDHLCYKKSSLYYSVMFLNLIFRCSWTLTISPSVISLMPKATILPLVTGLIEIVRRCIWNFFRIEKEHILNTNQFIVIKQKPQEVMSSLKKMKKKPSFEVETGQLDVQYTKVNDMKFLEMLKIIPGENLLRVDYQSVKESKKQFQEHFRNQLLKRYKRSEIDLKKFNGMRRNYFKI